MTLNRRSWFATIAALFAGRKAARAATVTTTTSIDYATPVAGGSYRRDTVEFVNYDFFGQEPWS
jgi:hypothetical protein